MIGITERAIRDVESLERYYRRLERYRAIENMHSALQAARAAIEANPHSGLTHPRPYPTVAAHGFLWRLHHRYWIAWSMTRGYPIIVHVFFETNDIPDRVSPTIRKVIPLQ